MGVREIGVDPAVRCAGAMSLRSHFAAQTGATASGASFFIISSVRPGVFLSRGSHSFEEGA